MAANALPATPLALSNKPDIPATAPFAIPVSDVAILFKPPVNVAAMLPAKLPAPIKPAADPSTVFKAPDAAPIAPDIAPVAAPIAPDIAPVTALAAFLTKSIVFCTPAVAADITNPAIAVPASFPVINPLCVNASCAFRNPTTAPATCTVGFWTYACKLVTPRSPVNRFGVHACSNVLPPCTKLSTNAAAPGFKNPQSCICLAL